MVSDSSQPLLDDGISEVVEGGKSAYRDHGMAVRQIYVTAYVFCFCTNMLSSLFCLNPRRGKIVDVLQTLNQKNYRGFQTRMVYLKHDI